ncbi:MAG: hypothetical protein QG657_3771, partial [Acidobacteriota bacterium]|nr:hypothetical protein [Acidobacteriota bacterium]
MPEKAIEDNFYDWFFEAEKNRADGHFKEAMLIYLELFSPRLKRKIDQETSFTNYDAIIIERLAELSQLFGVNEAAINLLTGLLYLYQKASNVYLYIYTIIQIASIFLEMGALEKTFSTLEQLTPCIGDIHQIEMKEESLALWDAECRLNNLDGEEQTVIFSRLYYVLGSLLSRLGQYNQAINCFDRGIHWLPPLAPDIAKVVLIPLSLERITALMEEGEISRAEKELQSIYFGQNEKITPGNYTGWLELHAKIQLLKGNFGEALSSLAKVMEICRTHQFLKGEVTSILNMVKVKLLLNQLAEAETLLDEASEICNAGGYEELLNRSKQLYHLLFARGSSYLSSIDLSPSAPLGDRGKNPDENIHEYAGAIDLPQAPDFLGFFEDRALGFQILLADRKFSKARLYLDNIKQVFANTDSILILHRLRILEFLIRYYQNETDQLPFNFKETLDFLERESLKPELYQFQRILSWTELLAPEEKKNIIDANTTLLEEMTQSLPPEYQAVFLLNKWTEDEASLAWETDRLLYLKLKKNKFKPFNVFSKFKMMNRLNKLLCHIDRYKDVLARNTINNKKDKAAPGSFSSLLYRILSHPRDRVTISFLALPDRVVIIYTTFLKFDLKVTYISRIQVREWIKEWHRSLVSSPNSRNVVPIVKEEEKKIPLEIPGKISGILQVPEILSGLPKAVKRITFIPDDSLNGFPFASLQYNGDYLIKKYSLAIGYESTIQKHTKNKTNKAGVLMAAISKGSDNFSALPGAEKEIDELKELFSLKTGDIKVIIDEEAKKETILSLLPQFKFFHIACHGKFEHNKPDA